ncbi:serine hydrolase domain-containing protein [Pendulispora albinea]|uniref:Beta-lactamase family protein n=1 Tax=Pendulispora albinea TaxID=2741071 RepID=A0ABZ2LTG0_9BACT
MKSRASAIAERIVQSGIAPRCAVAAARRQGGRWFAISSGAEDTLFDLASLTKPMTAVAVRASGLDASRPLADFVPELGHTASGDVAIDLLLAHRAGLRATCPVFIPLLVGGEVDRAKALVSLANARRPDAIGPAPPEGFAPLYSDVGYILAGEALARFVSARDAGEAIERLLIAPLGLSDQLGTARALEARSIDLALRAAPTEHVGWRGGVVRGRVHDESAWSLTRDGGSGHAGLFGTADAVLRFGCHVLDRIDDLAPLVRERPGGTLRAGFDGKSREGSSAGARMGPRAIGHLGFTGTSLWIDPDAQVVIVLLTNRVHPTRDHVAIRAARPVTHDALFELALAL